MRANGRRAADASAAGRAQPRQTTLATVAEPEMATSVTYLLESPGHFTRGEVDQWLLERLNMPVTESAEVGGLMRLLHGESGKVRPKGATEPTLLLGPSTQIRVISKKYRFAISVDMSRSMTTTSPSGASVLISEAWDALQTILIGIVQPFKVGADTLRVFEIRPEVSVSILAECGRSSLVVVQGMEISSSNIDRALDIIRAALRNREARLQALGGVASASTSLDEMVCAALFAINLMPIDSVPHIILITDATPSLSDAAPSSETVIRHLASLQVTVSAVVVGLESDLLVPRGFGYVADTDALRYVVQATRGHIFHSDELPSPYSLLNLPAAPSAVSAPTAPSSHWVAASPHRLVQDAKESTHVARVPTSALPGPNVIQQVFLVRSFCLSPLASAPAAVMSPAPAAQSRYDGVMGPGSRFRPFDRPSEILATGLANVNHYMLRDTAYPWDKNAAPPPVLEFAFKYKEYFFNVELSQLVAVRLREGYFQQQMYRTGGGNKPEKLHLTLAFLLHPDVTIEYRVKARVSDPVEAEAARADERKGASVRRVDDRAKTRTPRTEIYLTGNANVIVAFASTQHGTATNVSKSLQARLTTIQAFLNALLETDRHLTTIASIGSSPGVLEVPAKLRPKDLPLDDVFEPVLAGEALMSATKPNAPLLGLRASRGEQDFFSYWQVLATLVQSRQFRWFHEHSLHVVLKSTNEDASALGGIGGVGVGASGKLRHAANEAFARYLVDSWASFVLARNIFVRLVTTEPSAYAPSSSPSSLGSDRLYPRAGFVVLTVEWRTPYVMELELQFFQVPPATRSRLVSELRQYLANVGTPSGQPYLVLCDKPVSWLLAQEGAASRSVVTPRTAGGDSAPALDTSSPQATLQFYRPNYIHTFMKHARWRWFHDVNMRELTLPDKEAIDLVSFRLMVQRRLDSGFHTVHQTDRSVLLYAELRHGPDSSACKYSVQYMIERLPAERQIATRVFAEPLRDVMSDTDSGASIIEKIFSEDKLIFTELYSFERAHLLARSKGARQAVSKPAHALPIAPAANEEDREVPVPAAFSVQALLPVSRCVVGGYRLASPNAGGLIATAESAAVHTDLAAAAAAAESAVRANRIIAGLFEDSLRHVTDSEAPLSAAEQVPLADDAIRYFKAGTPSASLPSATPLSERRRSVDPTGSLRLSTSVRPLIANGDRLRRALGHARAFVKIVDSDTLLLILVPLHDLLSPSQRTSERLTQAHSHGVTQQHSASTSGPSSTSQSYQGSSMASSPAGSFRSQPLQHFPQPAFGMPESLGAGAAAWSSATTAASVATSAGNAAAVSMDPFLSTLSVFVFECTRHYGGLSGDLDVIPRDSFFDDEQFDVTGLLADDQSSVHASDEQVENQDLLTMTKLFLQEIGVLHRTTFICGIYASLLEEYSISRIDIAAALEHCQEESFDIDMTHFLTTCASTVATEASLAGASARFHAILGAHFLPVQQVESCGRRFMVYVYKPPVSGDAARAYWNAPLFVRLELALRRPIKGSVSVDDSFVNFSVGELPTSFAGWSDDTRTTPVDFTAPDIKNLQSPYLPRPSDPTATLRLVAMRLPPKQPSALTRSGSAMQAPLTPSGPFSYYDLIKEREKEQPILGDDSPSLVPREAASSVEVEGNQRAAIADTCEKIRWLLTDQILQLLLSARITPESLAFVRAQLTSSRAPATSRSVIPLTFVKPRKAEVLFPQELLKKDFSPLRLECEQNIFYFAGGFIECREYAASAQAAAAPAPSATPPPVTSAAASSGSSPAAATSEAPAAVAAGAPLPAPVPAAAQRKPAESAASSEETLAPQPLGVETSLPPLPPSKTSQAASPTSRPLSGLAAVVGDVLLSSDATRMGLPFWLLLSVKGMSLEVFFHSPSTVDAQQKRLVLALQESIVTVTDRVNRSILLQSLLQRHRCSPWLLAPQPEDGDVRADWSSDDEDEHMSGAAGVAPSPIQQSPDKASRSFAPGQFACPTMYKTSIPLNWRLKPAFALRSLNSQLSSLAVLNRSNMFVYQGPTGIFYIRLKTQGGENESETAAATVAEQPVQPAAAAPQELSRLSTLSFSESDRASIKTTGTRAADKPSKLATAAPQPPNELIVEVCGLDKPHPSMMEQLMQLLESKMALIILNHLSTLLARNATLKLSPADLDYVMQPHQAPAGSRVFALPPAICSDSQTLILFLKQHVLQYLQPLSPLLEHDPTVRGVFEQRYGYPPAIETAAAGPLSPDALDPDTAAAEAAMLAEPAPVPPAFEPHEFVFIYNSVQSRNHTVVEAAVGQGIGCLILTVVDESGRALFNLPAPPLHGTRLPPGELAATLDMIERDGMDGVPKGNLSLHLEVWSRGFLNVETLMDRVMQSLKQSICDILIELTINAPPADAASSQAVSGAATPHDATSRVASPEPVANDTTFSPDRVSSVFKDDFMSPISRVLDAAVKLGSPTVDTLSARVKVPRWIRDDVVCELRDVLRDANTSMGSLVLQVDADAVAAVDPQRRCTGGADAAKSRAPRSDVFTPVSGPSYYVLSGLEAPCSSYGLCPHPDAMRVVHEAPPSFVNEFDDGASFVLGRRGDDGALEAYVAGPSSSRRTSISQMSMRSLPADVMLFADGGGQIAAAGDQAAALASRVDVPRGCFMIVSLAGNTISVRSYNLSRGHLDAISLGVQRLVVWLSERLSVLDTVVHQKLGLFHHLPADVSVSFVTSSQKRALLGQPPISGSAAGTPLSAVASSTNLLSATTPSSASSPMAASSAATAPAGLLTHNASFPLPTLAASSAQRTRFSLENPSLDMVIQAVFLPRVSRTAAAAQGTASGSTAPVMSAPPNAASGGSGSGQPLDLKDILRERERKAASGTPTPPASAREPPKRGNDIRAIYKEHIPPVPLWKAPYGDTFDLVQRHGMQLRDVAQRIVERARSLDGWTTMYNRWSRFERDHIAPQDVDVLVRWGRLVHSVRSPVQLATRSARAGEKAAAAAADADDAAAEVNAGRHRFFQGVVHTFVKEYSEYLQSLGLVDVYTTAKGAKPATALKVDDAVSIETERHFFVKTHKVGFLLLEFFLDGGFACVNMYTLRHRGAAAVPERNRQARTIAQQTSIGLYKIFIEDCSRFNNYIHLHSFVYDFYLRLFLSLLTDRSSDVNLVDFVPLVRWFLRRNPQPARSARNRMKYGIAETLSVSNLTSKEMLSYLLQDAGRFGFQTLRHRSLPDFMFISTSAPTFVPEYSAAAASRAEFSYVMVVGPPDAVGGAAAVPADTVSGTLKVSLVVMLINRATSFPLLMDEHALVTSGRDHLMALAQKRSAGAPAAAPASPSAASAASRAVSAALLTHAADYRERIVQPDTLLENARVRINEMTQNVRVHQERDAMWKRLLAGKSGAGRAGLASAEFAVLLERLHVRPFESFDPLLADFFASINFWPEAVEALQRRFPDWREVRDGPRRHILLIVNNATDLLVMLTLVDTVRAGLTCAVASVRRERPEPEDDPLLVKEMEQIATVINALSHQLWLRMMRAL